VWEWSNVPRSAQMNEYPRTVGAIAIKRDDRPIAQRQDLPGFVENRRFGDRPYMRRDGVEIRQCRVRDEIVPTDPVAAGLRPIGGIAPLTHGIVKAKEVAPPRADTTERGSNSEKSTCLQTVGVLSRDAKSQQPTSITSFLFALRQSAD
jgi:hypothetical protein